MSSWCPNISGRFWTGKRTKTRATRRRTHCQVLVLLQINYPITASKAVHFHQIWSCFTTSPCLWPLYNRSYTRDIAKGISLSIFKHPLKLGHCIRPNDRWSAKSLGIWSLRFFSPFGGAKPNTPLAGAGHIPVALHLFGGHYNQPRPLNIQSRIVCCISTRLTQHMGMGCWHVAPTGEKGVGNTIQESRAMSR